MKFLILLLLSTSVLALKPHTATYTLSVSDFEIAQVKIALRKKGDVYTYTLDAQTEGLAFLIKDYQIRSKSTFTLNQFGLQSQRYQNFERDGNQVKKDIDIYLKKMQVDPLNQTLSISNALAKNSNEKNFYLLLNNGESIAKKYYQQVQNNSSNLIHVISSDGNTEVYFARNKYYIPVLIRNKDFTYKLNSVNFN
ncbi:hypothetical protein [Candidatus Thiodubiliella endoseptemdiera]|uniref:hypothetical protein n=1 Tax=Candidatus Thiodubiliella endoseptemdiera TaxID=2738886 RepID=UPI0034DFF8CF